ncbi:MAG: GAF domain-containing protein [Candidatus Krumholzibacteriia bacterium]
MSDGIRWSVVLACPAEAELSLLADLSARRDARIVAVADPDGTSLGAELAAIMGIPVVADLEAVPRPTDHVLVHGALTGAVAALLDDAATLGMQTVRADLFALRLQAPGAAALRVTVAPPSRPADATVESETAAIHRTLSRIEEALDRESLLRWVLGLAMRAVGAASGSIMLLDEATDELYVAFAHGLSDTTRHGTRVRPGEGIAGRVLITGRAERMQRGGPPGRDRGAIADAVCAPIVRNGRALGVVNLSCAAADGPLAPDALARAGALSHRLGELLERFLRLQGVADRDRLRRLDEDLGIDTLDGGDPLAVLRAWTDRLAEGVGAEEVVLGLLTEDGDLCEVGEGVAYVSPPDHDRATVLVGGTPVVVRTDPGGSPCTVIHLPVGRDPVKVVLTVTFTAAAAAHRFRTACDDFLYVVRRHLGHLLERLARGDEINRLTALASALSSLAELDDEEGLHDRVLAAARRLTGARRAVVVADGAAGDPLLDEARRLLQQAGEQGWAASVLDGRRAGSSGDAVSILVVPLDTTRPLPGLLLVGKTRLHTLDAATFTATDARFARRLLPLLRASRRAAPVPTPPPPAAALAAAGGGTAAVLHDLRRELDRCDRYHTMVGVAAFRLPAGGGGAATAGALGGRLRTSDTVGCLDDGTILVIVPEEVQSLGRLQKRVEELLRAITGAAGLVVSSASAVYPGPADDADGLLASVTRALA